MKMKKLVSLFAAICMVVALIPSVMAAEIVTTGIPAGWSVSGGTMESVYDADASAYVLKVTKAADATATVTYALDDTVAATYDVSVTAKTAGAKAGVADSKIDLTTGDAYATTTGTVTAAAGDDFVIEITGGTEAYIQTASFGAAAGVEYLGAEWCKDGIIDTRWDDAADVGNGGSKSMEETSSGTYGTVIEYYPLHNGNDWLNGGGFMCFESYTKKIPAGTWKYSITMEYHSNNGAIYIGPRFIDDNETSAPYSELVKLVDNSAEDVAWATYEGTIEVKNETTIDNNWIIVTDGTGTYGQGMRVARASFKQVLVSEGGANMLNCAFEKPVTLTSDVVAGSTEGWSVTGGSIESVNVERDGEIVSALKVTADGTATVTYDLDSVEAANYFVTVDADLNGATATAGVTSDVSVALADGKTEGEVTAAADDNLVIETTGVIYIYSVAVQKNLGEGIGEELLAMPNFDGLDDSYLGRRSESLKPDGLGWGKSGGYYDDPMEVAYDDVNGTQRKVFMFYPNPDRQSDDQRRYQFVVGDFNKSLTPGTYQVSILVKMSDNFDEGGFGLRYSEDGCLTDSKDALKARGMMFSGKGTYNQYTTEITVGDSDDELNGNGIAVVADGWGAEGCYFAIAEASVKQKGIIRGENIVPADAISGKGTSTFGWTAISPISQDDINVKAYVIDGVIKNVLRIDPVEGQGAQVSADAGVLAEGKYRVSAWVKVPGNGGNTSFGLKWSDGTSNRVDINDGNIVNGRDYWDYWSVDIDNTDTENRAAFNLKFAWGSAETIYVLDAAVQKVNDDGSLGENLLVNPHFNIIGPEVVENAPVSGEPNEAGKYTQGFSGTLTANEITVNGVNYTLSNGTSEYKGSFSFASITGASAIEYGINVLNVPGDVTVEITDIAANY